MAGTSTMKAVVMREFGGPEVLELGELPLPEPGPGEVRVRVEAVIVNTTRDVVTRIGAGHFSRFVTLPHVLGGEHAGPVDGIGDGVDPGLLGRRVVVDASFYCGTCEFCLAGEEQACVSAGLIGVHRQGAYAEFVVAPAANVTPIPDDVSSVEAAALITTGGVGLAQVEAAAVPVGGILVVPGVTGALGSMVAELATRRGVRVVGLARDVDRAAAMPLAVEAIVDARADGLEERLRDACGPGGAHGVVDNVCAPPTWDACLAVLRPRGRVVISGTMGPGEVSIDSRRLYLSNQSIIGLRTGNNAAMQAFWDEVRSGFRLPAGLLETFSLWSAADVHRRVQGGKVGHYVLVNDD
jgi:D-arabinose 1-dehydrogenase-like Zn-dependent alcohol dehydrogenase